MSFGEPFENYVKNQIEARQESLGQLSNISQDNLKYYTTKTPWLRLASSVDIKPDDLNRSGIYEFLQQEGFDIGDFSESNLARNFVLQGGAISIDKKSKLKDINKGINFDNNKFIGAYGWGGIEERGYVPMPGIESAEVKYLNNGALTKTTIKVKCFSKKQFQILDVLYLRPGYTLLLEFGHSVYLDNDGDLQYFEGFSTEPFRFLFNPKHPPKSSEETDVSGIQKSMVARQDQIADQTPINIKEAPTPDQIAQTFNSPLPPDQIAQALTKATLEEKLSSDQDQSSFGKGQFLMHEKIEIARKEYEGNYDAVYGMITNFNWTFNPDGSYSCTINLTGKGSIIESLKVNVVEPTDDAGDKDSDGEEPIVANIDRTTLDETLYNHHRSISNKNIESTSAIFSLQEKKFSFLKNKKKVFKKSALKVTNIDTIEGFFADFFGSDFSPQTYITFGYLICLLQDSIMIKDKNDVPFFEFDFNFENLEKDENYMLIHPGSFSSNPTVCLIPHNFNFSGTNKNQLQKNQLQKALNVNKNFRKSSYVGRLSQVYVNINHISKVITNSLEETKNGENTFSLLKFLRTLLNDISKSLGGINNFRVLVTPDDKVQIVDESPPSLNPNQKKYTDYPKINSFGVSENSGSFVKNINLDGEINNDFAASIAIGSQTGGGNIYANASSFSTYNKGLIDRITPEKTDGRNKKNMIGEETVTYKLTRIQNKIFFKGEDEKAPYNTVYGNHKGKDVEKSWIKPDISALTNYNSQFSNLKLEEGAKEANGGNLPFFLPFNLKLTTDGISGTKLYQKFRMDDKILPPSYDNLNILFQLKGINHSISPEGWTTEFETLPFPSPQSK